MARYRSTITDYCGEKSTMSVYVPDTAADADLTAFYGAVDAIVLGTMGDGILATEVVKDAGSNALPTSQFAQREIKWLNRYTDTVTNKRYQFEIAAPDLGELGGNVDQLDLTSGTGLALKTAFEAVAESPVGNAVTLDSVELVGRNN